jgi:hypothetical protein
MHKVIDRGVSLVAPSAAVIMVAFLALFGLSTSGPAMQTGPRVYLRDNSDWWSGSRSSESGEDIRIQERELASSNFRIVGIHLNEDMFAQAAAKLGPTTIVQRGDASTGRAQACYVSDEGAKIHLIFEQDEVAFTLYLFSDGRPWNGSDQCAHSHLISAGLSTASGLRLGQTPSEVIAILGEPSNQRKNELIYSVHVKKRASEEILKKLRQQNTQMSDEDFHKAYDFYDLGAAVHARFTDSKLTFLVVSRAETY